MHANKRWMCVALPVGRSWRVGIEKAAIIEDILPTLQRRAGNAAVALGIDAPIGLPEAYRNGRLDFRSFLAELSPDSEFFSVAETPAQVTVSRPFYPDRAVLGMSQRDLLAGVGFTTAAQLLRECERATPTQPAAAPLFWTVGAKQVGKAAICLWRDLLLPALRSADPPALWPFDGSLDTLLGTPRVVIAETYPALAMRQLDLRFVGSKTKQSDRLQVAGRLRAIMDDIGAMPDVGLATALGNGFGAGSDGEDRFDSLIGLLGMLRIVRNPALDHLPAAATLRWEGWILGRPLSTS